MSVGSTFIMAFKKAQSDTSGKTIMASVFTKYAGALVWIMLLVVFPPLWAVIMLVGTIGIIYGRWGKKETVSKLAVIPAWALGFLAGVISKKQSSASPESRSSSLSSPQRTEDRPTHTTDQDIAPENRG